MKENKARYRTLYNILKSKYKDDVFALFNSLTLEEIIALKLELSSKVINNKLYGFDLWANSSEIVKEALLIYAISATSSNKQAAFFLGITEKSFYDAYNRYELDKYFSEQLDEENYTS